MSKNMLFLIFYSDRANPRRASFAEPQWAPTPGQYLVLYDGEVCLGGGVITADVEVGASPHAPIQTSETAA